MKKHLILFLIALSITLTASTTFAQTKKAHPTQAVDNSTIDMIYNAMRQKSTDENKLMVVQDGLKNNTDGVTVDQILKLLNQFQTDDSKLECAKFTYAWCVDYKNYLKIQDNFGSDAAKQALKDFVKKQK